MIDVLLPYGTAMKAYFCRESPWGEVDEVNHDIVDWLETPGRDPDWDWGFQGDFVFFRFRDHNIAMLFKLMWL